MTSMTSLSNLIFNGERRNVFPLRSETKQGYPLSPFLFNTLLEVLFRITDKKKKNKSHWDWEERSDTIYTSSWHDLTYGKFHEINTKTFRTIKISKVAIQKINKNELYFHALAMSTLKIKLRIGDLYKVCLLGKNKSWLKTRH